ncbi:MAG: VPLPA-CTERM sorting domain-containing protein [Methylococcales bacterium]|nr:hypothetical protein [Methylococcaceae bacterium]
MKKIQTIFLALTLLPGINMANVVVNGTFDNNFTGWSGIYTAEPGGSAGFPAIDTGSYYWGNGVSPNSISQVYELTASDLNTLSNSGINFTMSGDLFGYSSQNDHSIFTAFFYSGAGGSGSLLGSVALDSATNDPGTWSAIVIAGNDPNFQTVSGALPNLTTSILLNLVSIRVSGVSNDGYADNLNFSISPSNVPVPPAVWLFGSGLFGLLGMRRKLVL